MRRCIRPRQPLCSHCSRPMQSWSLKLLSMRRRLSWESKLRKQIASSITRTKLGCTARWSSSTRWTDSIGKSKKSRTKQRAAIVLSGKTHKTRWQRSELRTSSSYKNRKTMTGSKRRTKKPWTSSTLRFRSSRRSTKCKTTHLLPKRRNGERISQPSTRIGKWSKPSSLTPTMVLIEPSIETSCKVKTTGLRPCATTRKSSNSKK